MSYTLILTIYTILILAAILRELNISIRNYKIKILNSHFKNKEYLKVIELLEKDKKRKIYEWEHKNVIIYLYFITNNYEKYLKAKNSYTSMNLKKMPEIEIKLNYLFKITENIFMYLHEEIDNANSAYEELIKGDDEIDKKLYNFDYKTWVLFQVLKMIYTYHNGNYNEVKKIYEYISSYAYDNTIKTLISYYICKIYEYEDNIELINNIILNTDIKNNYYGYYLDKWSNKQ